LGITAEAVTFAGLVEAQASAKITSSLIGAIGGLFVLAGLLALIIATPPGPALIELADRWLPVGHVR
jgi:hypothetical protein